MTEEQIERRVEKMIDRIDDRYMSGLLSEAEYRSAIEQVDRWAEAATAGIVSHGWLVVEA